jgi:hypothetical protein
MKNILIKLGASNRFFVLIFLLSISSLLSTKIEPNLIFLFFTLVLCLTIWIIFQVRIKSEKPFLIISILLLSLLSRFIPIILIGIPWQYNLHHAAYSRFLIENGQLFVSPPEMVSMEYQNWPGSHIYLAITALLTESDLILVYQIAAIIFSILAILFFYLIVKEVIQNNMVASYSALFIGLFSAFIQDGTHILAQSLARVMMLLLLYILVKKTNTNVYWRSIIAILALATAILSHGMEPVIFLVIFLGILTYNWVRKSSHVMETRSIIYIWIIFIAAYWVYLALSSFQGITTNIFTHIVGLVDTGYALKISWPFSGGASMFFPSWLLLIRIVSYAAIMLFGLVGILYIFNHRHASQGLMGVEISIPWFLVISIIAFMVNIFPILGTDLPAFRFYSYLLFPIVIGLSFNLAKLNLVSHPKFSHKLLNTLPIILLFVGLVTTFSPVIYFKPEIHLNSEDSADKAFGNWIYAHIDPLHKILTDNHGTEAAVFWGRRMGTWGNDIDILFSSKAGESRYLGYNYIALNIFNTKYHFYNKWGEYFTISSDSLALTIDNDTIFNKVYANRREMFYWNKQ